MMAPYMTHDKGHKIPGNLIIQQLIKFILEGIVWQFLY